MRLVGRELDPVAFSVGAARFATAQIHATITLGDSLRAPAFSDGDPTTRFDRVVLNPTWEQPFRTPETAAVTAGRFPYGDPPAECADWAWVQHGLDALAPAGRMAVLLDAAALSRVSEQHIRSAIVNDDLLATVVVCESTAPSGSPSARIVASFLQRAAILVFDRAKRHQGSTMFIDVGQLIPAHAFDFDLLVSEVVRRGHNWKAEPGVAGIVSRDEIALRRYDLRPRFYLSHDEPTSDIGFQRTM